MEIELDVKTIINNLKDHGVYKDECVRCFTENVRHPPKGETLSDNSRLMKTESTFVSRPTKLSATSTRLSTSKKLGTGCFLTIGS